MANKFATNYPIPTSTNTFSVLWKLTRMMKASGWSYKASANAAAKDTSGVASNDLWGTSADPTLDYYSNNSTTTNSGSISIAGFAGSGTLTVTSNTLFPSAGLLFVATTSNGWQPISYTGVSGSTQFTGCTTINAVGAIVNGYPVAAPTFTTLNSGSVALPQSTLTVSSTANFPSTGIIYVQASGGIQAVNYTSTTPTTFTGCSGGTGNIANGNIVSSGASTIGLDNVAGWLVLSGPQTVKIPISAAPTGDPIRGEKITQATSNAEGELLGYVWDTVSSSGWMSVMPRLNSFDNTDTITGASSTATFSPLSAGIITVFSREVMFYKITADTIDGTIYYICADSLDGANQTVNSTTIASGSNTQTLPQGTINVINTTGFPSTGSLLINTSLGVQLITYTGTSGGNQFTGCTGGTGTLSTTNSVTQSGAEGNQLWSTLATSSGTTAILGPGMGGTNNSYPSRGVAIRGTGGSSTSQPFFQVTNLYQNYAQIAATNCVTGTGVSADGSFYAVLTYSGVANTTVGLGLQRVDDQEPGDCDPYVFLTSGNQASNTTWTGASTIGSGTTGQTFSISNFHEANPFFLGYQSRGNSTSDTINGYTSMPQGDILGAATYAISTGGIALPMKLVNTPATVKPLIFESLALYSNGLSAVANSTRQYKGRLRWIFLTTSGNTYDTFASKTLLSTSVGATSTPCILIGPYDGVTTPIQ